jgi:ABC-type sugar transport system permease subunit
VNDALSVPHRSARYTLRKLKLPILFILPAVLIQIIFMAVPLIDAIGLSFQSWDGLSSPKWVGFRNYVLLVQDRVFWLALVHTAYFVVVTVVFQTTIPLLIAVLVGSRLVKGSVIFRTIYFMPVVISLTISGLLWSMIYEPNFGVLNDFLRSIGLKRFALLWLADKATVMPSIIVVSIWQSMGFYLVIFFAALQNIPQELYDSAAIDGANAWRRLISVTIPLLSPVVTVVVVLNTIHGIKVFDQVWVMTTGGPNHASDTLSTHLYSLAFGAGGSSNPVLGYASAIGVVILIITFIFSYFQLRWGRVGEIEY